MRARYEFAGPVAAERRAIASARVALGLTSTEDWVADLAAPAVADLRRELGLPPDDTTERLRSSALLSTVPPGLDDGPAHRFRDATPPAAPPLPDWWANADEPLIYLTFGSVTGSLPFFPGLYDTVLEALAPLPLFAGDQWRTARRVADVGAGIVLEDGERRVFEPPGPQVIAGLAQAVRRMLADTRFRQTAERLGREIATLAPADEAVAVIEAAAHR